MMLNFLIAAESNLTQYDYRTRLTNSVYGLLQDIPEIKQGNETVI